VCLDKVDSPVLNTELSHLTISAATNKPYRFRIEQARRVTGVIIDRLLYEMKTDFDTIDYCFVQLEHGSIVFLVLTDECLRSARPFDKPTFRCVKEVHISTCQACFGSRMLTEIMGGNRTSSVSCVPLARIQSMATPMEGSRRLASASR
jgi:hypothetical protein